jgi:hypothetical protein
MEGNFVLPDYMTEGTWTVTASYPYFNATAESFNVTNGVPEQELDPMMLKQLVRFSVTCDKSGYLFGDTVKIFLVAQNLTDETVVLASLTSPQVVYAVVSGGKVVPGGLMPGNNPEPAQIQLKPSESQVFELAWNIEDSSLLPGSYEIYAAITTSQTHPSYFDPDTEMMAQFNSTLYKKLTPAAIELQ